MTLTQRGALLIDDNMKPVQWASGLTSTDAQVLTGNGTTVNVPIFGVTGQVTVLALWGVVTKVLGNNTAAYWRLNDQSAQTNITLNTGTSLTSAAVGATLAKKGLATAALTLLSAAAGDISEPTTLETPYFSPFVAVQKTGGITTNIEFVYTTSDTPTSGAITFYAVWYPLSQGSELLAL